VQVAQEPRDLGVDPRLACPSRLRCHFSASVAA
jgi:hypothetical protein